MKQALLTRKDSEVGDGLFDSIAWAFSEHIKETDTGEFNSALLYGNEDAPERIELYRTSEPLVDTPIDRTWVSIGNRLEELRAELQAERISYGELAELQSLAKYIAPGDVELLEAAGVLESEEAE
jgi:hypothetical protein